VKERQRKALGSVPIYTEPFFLESGVGNAFLQAIEKIRGI
jgi:hypothetical protein